MAKTSFPGRARLILNGAALALLIPVAGEAHGVVGDRIFPVTLTIDDPAMSDEVSVPTFVYQPGGGANEYDYGFEWDKRLTENFGLIINDRYRMIRQPAAQGGNQFGWDNPVLTAKYQFLVNVPHEIIASIGVQKAFGGVGATDHDLADTTGWTQPTVYFGKGMGDLPASLAFLRPLAITGEFGYQWADEPTVTAADGTRSTNPDFWNLGGSVQYDLGYLASQVKDLGLPAVVNRLVPLVEFSYSTPASRYHPGATTTGTIAPGLIYQSDYYQFGVEALIPATRASGNAVGAIAQFHVFLDDLLPTTLGRPLF